jgi:hypothetical protein
MAMQLTVLRTAADRQVVSQRGGAMWMCYENDVAYILLADEHPGEAAIKLFTVQPRRERLKRVGVGVDGKPLQTLEREADVELVPASRTGDEQPNSVARTASSLILELDRDNRVVAIEVWGASKALPQSFLQLAAQETRPKPIRRT